MKYNDQWRKKKLENISNILSSMISSEVKNKEYDDSVSGYTRCPLLTFVACAIGDDGFHFNGEVFPDEHTVFDQEAVSVKVNLLSSTPSKYNIDVHASKDGNPHVSMHVPYNLSDNLMQLCDPISVFVARLFSLSHFMNEYGIVEDA